VRLGDPFNFLPVPTDIHFGCGVVRKLPELLRSLGAARPMIVADPGVRALIDRVSAILAAAGIEAVVWDRVRPDSGSTLIEEGRAELAANRCDAVIGLGGGSSLDTAKAIAAMATNPGSPLEYTGLHKVKNRPLPVVTIPTTAGTGSEVTLWSVFTDDVTGAKVAIGSVLLYPAVALCDPELTLGLPAGLTAATGMDALAHAIECYTNNACQPISAALALRAIEFIGRHLRSAVLNGGNVEARSAMMLASTMAGIAMNSTRLGLAHALAMPLGSWELHIPHGVILAVTLPYVMEFNYRAEPERFVEVACALGEPVEGLPRMEAAARAVTAARSLAVDVGIPASLRDYGLREEHVQRVAAEAVKSGNVAVNPRRAGTEDLLGILRQAL
jgi:alcohol dehydrogenase class IV